MNASVLFSKFRLVAPLRRTALESKTNCAAQPLRTRCDSSRILHAGHRTHFTPFRAFLFSVAVLVLHSQVHAAVTNVAWYRLGENDPGAASGQAVNSTTVDVAGGNSLKRLGSARYTNDVSPDAAQIGSSLAMLFTGTGFYSNTAVATAAGGNFGIEAWARILDTGDGTYHTAYNGRRGANGWGIGMHVTNNPLFDLQISYVGELGGGFKVGPARPRH